MFRSIRFFWSASALAVLTACGGSGGGSASGGNNNTNTLTGLAATGAAIANGDVIAKCTTGAPIAGKTDVNGVFTLNLTAAHTAPCMLQVIQAGPPKVELYSFATAAGQVNISPLTDLVVAKAMGSDPAAAFSAFDASKGSSISGNLVAAKSYVQTQVQAITGSGTSDPLTSTFTVGSADDQVLDALGAAIAQSGGKTFADLRTGAQSGSPLTNTVPAFLSAPTGATATANGASQITVNWAAVPAATGYNVYSSTSPNVQLVAGNKLTATPVAAAGAYAVTHLAASTAYYFKVTAVNTVVAESAASAEVSASTGAAAVPVAPTGLSVTPNSATQITVSWNGVSGATGYNVYRSATAGGVGSKVNASPINAAMNYVDTGLSASTAYFYKVTALNASGEGAASAEATTTTSAASATLTVTTMSNAMGPVSSGKVGDSFYVVGTGFELNNVSATFTGNVPGAVAFLNGSMFTLTIPTGAKTGPIVFKNKTSGATFTSASFTILATPVAVAHCTANGVATTLPATGVTGVDWSDCRDQSPGASMVAWGGNQFVAAGQGSFSTVIKTSVDGYTWTASPSKVNFDQIAFNGIRWIGLVSNSLTTAISYSTNTTVDTWTNVPVTLKNPGVLLKVHAANDRFFVSTNNGTWLSSTNGSTWTEFTAPCPMVVTSGQPDYNSTAPSSIEWINGRYRALCSNGSMQISSDGIAWTAVSPQLSGNVIPNPNYPAVRGSSPTLTISFSPTAIAFNGSVYAALSGTTAWTSSDGVTWVYRGSTTLAGNAQSMVWAGNMFVALGKNPGYATVNDSIVSSPDGQTWTARNSASATMPLTNFAYSPTLNRLLITGVASNTRNALFVSP